MNTLSDRTINIMIVLNTLVGLAILIVMGYLFIHTHNTPRIIPTELKQVRDDLGYYTVPRSNVANPSPTPRTYKTDEENAKKTQ